MDHLLGRDSVIIKRAGVDFFRMSSRWAVPIAAVLLTAGFLLVVDCTDDSDAANENITWERNGDDVTVRGYGSLHYASGWSSLKSLTVIPEGGEITFIIHAFSGNTTLETLTIQGSVDTIGNHAFYNCANLTTVTIQGFVGSIEDHAFHSCDSLATVTIAGPISSIDDTAFDACNNLKTVNIACTIDIEPGDNSYGHIAANADIVNHIHRYSAAYDWADDGSSCTVHINCLNDSALIHDDHPEVTHTVKIQPTETIKGTTEYSVSGTYDGFAYSDTKDVQDIPATGSSKDNTLMYIAAGGAIAAIALIGGAFVLLRRP